MKVIVTGGAGHLGEALVRVLLEKAPAIGFGRYIISATTCLPIPKLEP